MTLLPSWADQANDDKNELDQKQTFMPNNESPVNTMGMPHLLSRGRPLSRTVDPARQ
jgi:hypothetical protein